MLEVPVSIQVILNNIINTEANIFWLLKDSVNTAAKWIKRCCSKTDTLKAYFESAQYCYKLLLDKINSLQGSSSCLFKGEMMKEKSLGCLCTLLDHSLRSKITMCPKRWAGRWTINIVTNALLAKPPGTSHSCSRSKQNKAANKKVPMLEKHKPFNLQFKFSTIWQ